MYAGLTLEELAGHGVRWPARSQAALPTPARAIAVPAPRAPVAPREGELELSSYRPIWAAPEVAASPALAFLHPEQRVELCPADAARLGVRDGAWVGVADERGVVIRARVALRDAVPAGRCMLLSGLPRDSANRLSGATVRIVEAPAPPEEVAVAVIEEILV